MNIHIRYFASLRESVEKSEETLPVQDGATVAALRASLLTRYPRLQTILERSLCAVNHTYVPLETLLHEGDEVVFIPPVGGGEQDQIKLENPPDQEVRRWNR
ncbi:MAG TPA: molybdopterin converting factor subunit 1 [Ktedonobacteraceae bacterium]|nr:molybdopterin converting factor subunit 1 [Ktedonobacteraceae bacterium]